MNFKTERRKLQAAFCRRLFRVMGAERYLDQFIRDHIGKYGQRYVLRYLPDSDEAQSETIDQLSAVVASMASDVTALSNRVSILAGRYETLEASCAGLSSKLEALEMRLQANCGAQQ